jgi:two-component system nitrogen regulation sensor histidine kinase NtrY
MMLLEKLKRSWLGRNTVLLLVVAAFVSAIYTYISITGSSEQLGIKPKRVWTLLGINLGILSLLLAFIVVRFYQLWRALKAGTAGSRLQKRILVLFTTVTIVPTLIVSVFSALFFDLGIQTWFNDRVQTAVEESLEVAEVYLAEHKENIRVDALALAADLNRVSSLAITEPQKFNEIVVNQSNLRLLTEAIVFQRNRILAQGQLSFALAFERISPDAMKRADEGDVVLITDEEDKVRALIKLQDIQQDTYLLVGRLIDGKVMTHMQNTQGAVNAYSNLRNQMDRLQVVFLFAFATLATLLLLSAVGYATVFASRLTTPISRLVQASERVRSGDFSARVEDSGSKDELGTLGRVFNRMTEQLEAQRSDLIEANRRLDERRRFSEAVLAGVSAGVIALDRDKKITLFNRSAQTIFSAIGQPVSSELAIGELLPGIGELLAQAEHVAGDISQSSISISREQKTIRVAVEKLGEEVEGYIVTFDDITLLVSAQRHAAWSDVARRVAHEIKNPLTPIQLSAERLKRKYLKYIEESEQESYSKYIDTIARHVGDIGKMVEEFVSFARMPTASFSPENITAIAKKAVFSAQVAHPTIQHQLSAPTEPLYVHCDERQMTQVFTNLLKNAAESIEEKKPVQGLIRLALWTAEGQVLLVFSDNGTGFPPQNMAKMFDPYVTTRSKGTGLGLSIVKKIVDDHKGQINIENMPEGGAKVSLSFLQQCDINDANQV